MTRIFLAIAFALFFAAPSQAQTVVFVPIIQKLPDPQIGNTTGIHKIAILSGFGSNIVLQYNSTWVSLSGHKAKQIDVSDWNIDRQVEATLRQYLGEKFFYASLDYDPQAIANLPDEGLLVNTYPDLQKILRGLPKSDVDAYLVVRPYHHNETPGIFGLAIESEDNRLPVIWANYEIDIIDAHTLETISKAYSRVQLREGEAPGFAALIGVPELRFDDKFSISDQQRPLMRAFFYRLLPASLLETVRALKISDNLPKVGDRPIISISAEKDPFPAIKSVAVISAVGNKFQINYQGNLFNRSKVDYLPINGWHLDEEIEAAASKVLASRFTVKQAMVDRTQVMNSSLINKDQKFVPSFPGIPMTEDVDAYLIFVNVPERLGNGFETSGVGIWKQAVLDSNAAVFAHYAAVLVDARTLKVLRLATASASPKYPSSAPFQKIDNALWVDTAAAVTPEQNGKMHGALSEILTDSIDETLLRMRITGKEVGGVWPMGTQASDGAAAP